MSKAYLILQDGSVYEGEGFGAAADSVGELVFNTGVVGYIETLTDPSYYGQIVMQTFPAVGNYGVIEEDFEGDCCVKGYVVREWCRQPSNFRSQYDLDAFLKAQGVPGICGVDTRAITQRIRERGVMNAMIADRVPDDLSALQSYAVTGGVAQTSSLFSAVNNQGSIIFTGCHTQGSSAEGGALFGYGGIITIKCAEDGTLRFENVTDNASDGGGAICGWTGVTLTLTGTQAHPIEFAKTQATRETLHKRMRRWWSFRR